MPLEAPRVAPGALAAASAQAAPLAPSTTPDASSAKIVGAPTKEVVSAPTEDVVGAPTKSTGARLYAKARFVWIHTSPSQKSGWIGYLTLGGSVALKGGSAEAALVPGGSGCTWYRVEPQGFVCAGKSATLDPDDPEYATLARYGPKTDSPWPFQYGESTGLPRYTHIPTTAEQRSNEWDLDEHMDRVRRAREATSPEAIAAIDKELPGVDLSPAGKGPPELIEVGPLVREGRKRIVDGSTVAYTTEFDAGDRTWLLAWDHAIVPKDRVRPYPRSEFHGVLLGEAAALPIAFFRREARPQYRRGDDGTIAPTGSSWPAKAWVALTGERATQGTDTFLATRDGGLFAKESDATVVKPDAEPPFGRGAKGSKRRTWLEVSVLGGWLIAYEDKTPVFATLISPGRGGIPYPGRDPLETASTPLGTFRVDGKFVTATMVSSTNDLLVHTEVQYVQNFHGPHALHGAYWHDAWGQPKSGGCVNLAPLDAMRMFHWTEPEVPEGWYGMRSVPELGPATIVVIHR